MYKSDTFVIIQENMTEDILQYFYSICMLCILYSHFPICVWWFSQINQKKSPTSSLKIRKYNANHFVMLCYYFWKVPD